MYSLLLTPTRHSIATPLGVAGCHSGANRGGLGDFPFPHPDHPECGDGESNRTRSYPEQKAMAVTKTRGTLHHRFQRRYMEPMSGFEPLTC